MSLKAEALRVNRTQKIEIDKYVKDILGHFDDELKSAHERGIHEITLSAPIMFPVAYMPNATAQRMIYYKALKSLLDRGFLVQIDMQKDATLFEITWVTNEEKADWALEVQLLAKHSKKSIGKVDLSKE
jgi:hypothetical protein